MATLDIGSALNETVFAPISGDNYDAPALVSLALNLALIFGALVSFFFLLWGAIQWITSGGDKEGLEKAKKKITGALVGLVILFSIFAVGTLIKNVFDVNIFQLCIPSITGPCAPATQSGP